MSISYSFFKNFGVILGSLCVSILFPIGFLIGLSFDSFAIHQTIIQHKILFIVLSFAWIVLLTLIHGVMYWLFIKPVHQFTQWIERPNYTNPPKDTPFGWHPIYKGCGACSKRFNNQLLSLTNEKNELLDLSQKNEHAVVSTNNQLIVEMNARQTLEHECQTIKQTLEEANRFKKEFMANMSHEIRTPMNGINGMITLLLNTQLNKEQTEYATMAKKSADSLLSVINDVMEYNKIVSSAINLERMDFDLYKVLDNVEKNLSMFAEEKKLSFQCDIDPNVPQLLWGDPMQLRKIIIQLTHNAIKFTEHGSVSFGVSLKDQTETHATLNFWVKDTGIGIPKEKLPLIFDSFRQIDGTFTRKFGGTGLGLSITRELVEKMNGELIVNSKLGEGTTFNFSLVFEKQTKQLQPAQPDKPSLIINDADKQKVKILLVEDNIVSQKVALSVLKRFGYHADTADNGRIALEALRQKEYDIILLDIQMPEINGIDVTKTIRDKKITIANHLIPIIAMTAHTMNGDRETLLNYGMNEYISKPIDPFELKEKLETLLFANKPTNQIEENIDIQTIVDYQSAVNNLGGDMAFYRNVLSIFIDDFPQQLKQLKEAILNKSTDQLIMTSLSIKTSAATIMANPIKQLSFEIGKAGDDNDIYKAELLIEKLENEYMKLKSIASHLPES